MMAWAVIMIMAGVVIGGAAAQNTPPQSSACTSAIFSLSPCLSYITGNNGDPKPSRGCCNVIGPIVKNSAGCLCQLFGSRSPLGVPVNRTRALSLATACNIKTTRLTQCAAASVPATPPPASPDSNVAQSTESVSPAASEGGHSALSPTTSVDASSGGAAVYAPSMMALLVVLILAAIGC